MTSPLRPRHWHWGLECLQWQLSALSPSLVKCPSLRLWPMYCLPPHIASFGCSPTIHSWAKGQRYTGLRVLKIGLVWLITELGNFALRKSLNSRIEIGQCDMQSTEEWNLKKKQGASSWWWESSGRPFNQICKQTADKSTQFSYQEKSIGSLYPVDEETMIISCDSWKHNHVNKNVSAWEDGSVVKTLVTMCENMGLFKSLTPH